MKLDAIRACLEGVVPSAIATCAADGTPNVTYISHVEYVDSAHVALTFQFFNKTRRNILENPVAVIGVVHPTTAAMYRLRARYQRTETAGPLFERMRARLASIASHTGMADVFHLQGADVYLVEAIEHVSGPALPGLTPSAPLVALRALTARMAAATELGALLDVTLDGLAAELGIEHASILLLDRARGRLSTVASRGYGASGVGSEIPLGAGAIGVAAAHATPIRLAHFASEYGYAKAVRERVGAPETEIPLPGLAAPHSQLAVPLAAGGQLIGVLFAESERIARFSFVDEDTLAVLACTLAALIRALGEAADADEEAAPAARPVARAGTPRRVQHYAADDSVFVDGEYLIKGVAGAVLWKLVREHAAGREHFTNRELRKDRALGLPEIADNLEARLVLLERRLRERQFGIAIEKTGRGKFRLVVTVPLELVEG